MYYNQNYLRVRRQSKGGALFAMCIEAEIAVILYIEAEWTFISRHEVLPWQLCGCCLEPSHHPHSRGSSCPLLHTPYAPSALPLNHASAAVVLLLTPLVSNFRYTWKGPSLILLPSLPKLSQLLKSRRIFEIPLLSLGSRIRNGPFHVYLKFETRGVHNMPKIVEQKCLFWYE